MSRPRCAPLPYSPAWRAVVPGHCPAPRKRANMPNAEWPWMAGFGALAGLREKNRRIEALIEEEIFRERLRRAPAPVGAHAGEVTRG